MVINKRVESQIDFLKSHIMIIRSWKFEIVGKLMKQKIESTGCLSWHPCLDKNSKEFKNFQKRILKKENLKLS
jgi:hypothetical protein